MISDEFLYNITISSSLIFPILTNEVPRGVPYVIHAVSPVWQDGNRKEQQLMESCYEKSLQVAINAFRKFLLRHEMQIYLREAMRYRRRSEYEHNRQMSRKNWMKSCLLLDSL